MQYMIIGPSSKYLSDRLQHISLKRSLHLGPYLHTYNMKRPLNLRAAIATTLSHIFNHRMHKQPYLLP
jgi:hypothetical protein